MSTNHNERVSRPRRRTLVSLVSSAALLGAGTAALVLVGGGAASAASTADVSVSQSISGSSTAGSTVDTITIHNAGTATATGVNLNLFLKSTSTSYGIHPSVGSCPLMPPPVGYIGSTSCALGSLASGATIKEVVTYGGKQGVAFSSLATVGATVSDPKWSNNSSTVSSWFGPRADLAISGTAGPGTTAGSGVATTTVINHGPNTANALQLVTEIKSTGIKTVVVLPATPVSSCQIIPAASGYNLAVSCVTNSLKTGQKWVLPYKYSGAKGAAITEVSKVTANNPVDPVSSNNSMTKTTTLHS